MPPAGGTTKKVKRPGSKVCNKTYSPCPGLDTFLALQAIDLSWRGQVRGNYRFAGGVMNKVYRIFVEMMRDDEGASLAEYGLIASLVLVGVGISIGALTSTVANSINEGAECLELGSNC